MLKARFLNFPIWTGKGALGRGPILIEQILLLSLVPPQKLYSDFFENTPHRFFWLRCERIGKKRSMDRIQVKARQISFRSQKLDTS